MALAWGAIHGFGGALAPRAHEVTRLMTNYREAFTVPHDEV